VIMQVVPDNSAIFVEGLKFSRQIGITPIFQAGEMRSLINSIPVTREVKIPKKHGGGFKEVPDVKGRRDRAAIAIMAYTFARVSAVAGLKREDYRIEGKRAQLRLLEKGNKEKLVSLHHEAEQFLDAWLAGAHIKDGAQSSFQTLDKVHRLTGVAMSRRDFLRL
jgi:integrase/recombinase XerD